MSITRKKNTAGIAIPPMASQLAEVARTHGWGCEIVVDRTVSGTPRIQLGLFRPGVRGSVYRLVYMPDDKGRMTATKRQMLSPGPNEMWRRTSMANISATIRENPLYAAA